MRTSYRDIALLACCQALLLVNNSGLISMNGLVGYALAPDKSLATLGATTYVLGSALAAMPASLWMARVGRRHGFMTGSVIAIVGSATCALGLWLGAFPCFVSAPRSSVCIPRLVCNTGLPPRKLLRRNSRRLRFLRCSREASRVDSSAPRQAGGRRTSCRFLFSARSSAA
jgi:hypothetical protein